MQVLAHFSYYDLTTLNGSSRTGRDYIPIEQAQAELLQALALSIPSDELANETVRAADLRELNRLLNEIPRAFNGQAGDKSDVLSTELIRSYTQTVRMCVMSKKPSVVLTV